MRKLEKFSCFLCHETNSWNIENEIPSSVTPIFQQNITHMEARYSFLINVGIMLLSKFTFKVEYKTKEDLINSMRNNDSLMSSRL